MTRTRKVASYQHGSRQEQRSLGAAERGHGTWYITLPSYQEKRMLAASGP